MSFERSLRAELDRVGIRGALARRIEIELADHRRCDPDAPLGDSRRLAESFARDLRAPLTGRATTRSETTRRSCANDNGVAFID